MFARKHWKVTLAFVVVCGLGMPVGFAQTYPRNVIERLTDLTLIPAQHDIVLAEGGPFGITITLPAVGGNSGRHFTIKKVDTGAGAVRIPAERRGRRSGDD